MNPHLSAEQPSPVNADSLRSPEQMGVSDTHRQMAIAQLGKQVEFCMKLAQGSSLTARRWRAEAEAAKRDMEALINGRSAAEVWRMEQQ